MNTIKHPKHEWKPFFRLLGQAKLPWGFYLLNIILGFAISSVYTRMPQVAGSIMAGEIFDSGLVAVYIGVTIAFAVINIPLGIFTTWISLTTDKRLRRVVWKKIIHLPLKETDKVEPSSLISRVTSDTSQVGYGVDYICNMCNYVYSLVLTLIIINGINHKMMLMMFILVPFIILANIPSHYMHDAENQKQTALSNYTSFLAERLGSIRQIKAFNAEKREDEINAKESRSLFKAFIRQAKLNMIAQPLIYSLDAVVQAVILIFGGYLLSTGEIMSADIVTLFMYASSISLYAYQFIFCWQSIKKAQGAARTVSEIVSCDSEKMEREKSFAIPDADIRMENVCFAYGEGENIIAGLNITIPKGKTTAIVGPSGSGKTTVLKLLERLYTPNSGVVSFGDVDAEKINLDEWRDSFGMVPQNSPLLFGTIGDNITYGLGDEVSEEEINRVIELSNVKEILDRLPEGMQSDVGDVGDKLSGGEKQRIALARMMIRNPEYLLLDEATSNLDAENEYQITTALREQMKDKTAVVVTHNLKTVTNADNIIFMDHGKAVAQGTHEELLASNELYQKYVELQEI